MSSGFAALLPDRAPGKPTAIPKKEEAFAGAEAMVIIMKLVINGDLNRSYAQTLCLIFFPGAKFSEKEEITPDTPSVTFSVTPCGETAVVSARVTCGGKTASASHTEPYARWESTQKTHRIAAGVALLDAGTRMFGSAPAWGILTGVRPAKLALQAFSAGKDRDGVIAGLTDEYFVTPKKAALTADIAMRESALIERYGNGTCSLYISVPFCPTRCAYCSFVSYSTKRLLSLIPAYIERLCEDIRRMFRIIRQSGLKLIAVYIGGGTPSILDCGQLERLLSCVSSQTDPGELLEYTLEAGRPDTITPEKLRVAKSYGVTRISINPQTLNDEVLHAIGRKHTADDFYRAFAAAREIGGFQINTDLIAGLPGDSFDSFSRTVDTVTELKPENITVHTFCVKKSADILNSGARIYSRTGGDTGKCVEYSQLTARANGYEPYYIYRQKNAIGNLENVGFAQPGTEGLYNIFIMEEIHSIFAVGAGAVTKLVDRKNDHITRIFMPKYPYEYLSMGNEPGQTDRFFEKIGSELPK